MKALILIVLIASAAMKLEFAKATDPDDPLESTVRTLLAGGAWEGQRDKQLIQAGDRVAVAIAKSLGDRDDGDVSDLEVGLTLDMLNISFSNVSLIAHSSRPKASRSAICPSVSRPDSTRFRNKGENRINKKGTFEGS
jgi:hypothetical protein